MIIRQGIDFIRNQKLKKCFTFSLKNRIMIKVKIKSRFSMRYKKLKEASLVGQPLFIRK
jgi:hypothetical protein